MRRYYCECCETYQILTDDFLKSLIEKETNRYERPPEDYHWHGERLLCDFCNDPDEMYPGQEETWMNLIPDYETPEQYEKRTGKLYPDEGRVWVKDRLGERWWIDFKDDAYGDERRFIVCVNGPLPPPDGWRPE